MDANISINISLDDLKILIKDGIQEYFLEESNKSKKSVIDLLSFTQVLDKFYIKPERLKEWKDRGLINEYPVGKTVKFKISELFLAIDQVLKEHRAEKKEDPQ
jgi:hypothetical protein